ncbi:MAG: hypothetical protein ABEK04_00425 [Candidatus Nanohalobium sp.]
MVRKGQMHVLDAIAAVIVLLFFAIANFGGGGYKDWSSYENKIAAKDLSYTLKKTGHLESFITRGETGNIKTAITTVSERDLQVAGKIQGVPPNLDIGFYSLPSELKNASVQRVTSGDRCHGSLDEIESRSVAPLLRTEGGSGTMESQHGDVRLYFGKYNSVTPGLDYNAIWIDNGTQCSFAEPTDPVMKNEMFRWGPSGEILEFRKISVNVDNWQGELELAKAAQMKRFKQTMKHSVGKVNNKAKIDSFTLGQDLSSFDLLVFRTNKSIQHIENRRSAVNGQVGETPMLFLADLNQSFLENRDFLHNQGFRWEPLQYTSQGGSCPVTGPHKIDSNPECNLEVSFSDIPNSQGLKDNILGQRTKTSDISLYPGGSVTFKEKGPISYEKLLYLENYVYGELSKDRINRSMTPTTVGGRPSTHCNNVTQASFTFPKLDGGTESLTVVNTQLGQTDSYCDRNNRAVYIDLNGDSSYSGSGEGPYLDGEKLEINGVTYRVKIYSPLASNCGTDDCVGFIVDENAKVNVLNFNSGKKIGRAAYEERYSKADRKVLAAFMYMMAGATEIPSTSRGDVSTNIYGVLGDEPYRVSLRWSN